ncbi:MAG TPA: hypothetical protein VF458_01875 [Ktedonobacteraceae bacterium]
MQKSQKKQRAFFAFRSLLDDLDIGEEQFQQTLDQVVQAVDLAEGEQFQQAFEANSQVFQRDEARVQLPETPAPAPLPRDTFWPLAEFRPRQAENCDTSFPNTDNSAFRTELLARFFLVMFAQSQTEK